MVYQIFLLHYMKPLQRLCRLSPGSKIALARLGYFHNTPLSAHSFFAFHPFGITNYTPNNIEREWPCQEMKTIIPLFFPVFIQTTESPDLDRRCANIHTYPCNAYISYELFGGGVFIHFNKTLRVFLCERWS